MLICPLFADEMEINSGGKKDAVKFQRICRETKNQNILLCKFVVIIISLRPTLSKSLTISH